MNPRITVVHHSRRGTMRGLAVPAAEGARAAGAEVRLLRVADDDPAGAAWPERVAVPEDVLWADGLILATPTYFGNVSSPVKRFLESATPLWRAGLLENRLVTGMTSSSRTHGGREATLFSLYHTMYHWGCWAVGADPADPVVRRLGGNPYGLSVSAARDRAERPSRDERDAAAALGRRLARLARHVRRPAPDRVPERPVRVAVVRQGDGGPLDLMARQVAAGARAAGGQVRLRSVPDPRNPAAGRPPHPEPPAATPADIVWADAVVFGAPARLGAMAAPLMEFVQSLEPSAGPNPLSGKPASAFVTAPRRHSGSESALLGFHHLLFHSGALVVPPGYTDPSVSEAGGNPYGTSHPATAGTVPPPGTLAAAAYQGRRMAWAGGLFASLAVPQPRGLPAHSAPRP